MCLSPTSLCFIYQLIWPLDISNRSTVPLLTIFPIFQTSAASFNAHQHQYFHPLNPLHHHHALHPLHLLHPLHPLHPIYFLHPFHPFHPFQRLHPLHPLHLYLLSTSPIDLNLCCPLTCPHHRTPSLADQSVLRNTYLFIC